MSSFVFALTVLRSVRGKDDADGSFVPQVSVTLAFVLVLASVGCFLAFIDHITTSIQVGHTVARIGNQTTRVVDCLYPPYPADQAEPESAWSPTAGQAPRTVKADGHGRITEVDYRALVRTAHKNDCVVVMAKGPGDFFADGQTLALVWGGGEGKELHRAVNRAVSRGTEPSMSQDVSFGIRQLVDIAERALSSGINDPTTAVQALDQIHRVLRDVVQRGAPSPYLADEHNEVRVVQELPDALDLVRLGTSEIAHYGQETIQIPRRLSALFDDLLDCCLDRYRAGLSELRDEVPTTPQGRP